MKDDSSAGAGGFAVDNRWKSAEWVATTYRWHPTGDAPPILGLVFADWQKGVELFAIWTDECGNTDESDAIRVSIIEGEIEGQLPGYSVHIAAEGKPDPGQVQRMHPTPETEGWLGQFKAQQLKHGEFLLCPCEQRDDGRLWFKPEAGIVKRTCHFRDASEITGENDPDYAVLTPPPGEQALADLLGDE